MLENRVYELQLMGRLAGKESSHHRKEVPAQHTGRARNLQRPPLLGLPHHHMKRNHLGRGQGPLVGHAYLKTFQQAKDPGGLMLHPVQMVAYAEEGTEAAVGRETSLLSF